MRGRTSSSHFFASLSSFSAAGADRGRQARRRRRRRRRQGLTQGHGASLIGELCGYPGFSCTSAADVTELDPVAQRPRPHPARAARVRALAPRRRPRPAAPASAPRAEGPARAPRSRWRGTTLTSTSRGGPPVDGRTTRSRLPRSTRTSSPSIKRSARGPRGHRGHGQGHGQRSATHPRGRHHWGRVYCNEPVLPSEPVSARARVLRAWLAILVLLASGAEAWAAARVARARRRAPRARRGARRAGRSRPSRRRWWCPPAPPPATWRWARPPRRALAGMGGAVVAMDPTTAA